VKFWTAHTRSGGPPILVREGFSWWALLFGPIWLAVHRVWIPAVLTVVGTALILLLTNGGTTAALLASLVMLLGLSGQDLRRWSLDHRGYLLAQVLAARSESEALMQLLERRPDLKGSFLRPEDAR
jgi:cell division protein FtsW (lipid II flippase)